MLHSHNREPARQGRVRVVVDEPGEARHNRPVCSTRDPCRQARLRSKRGTVSSGRPVSFGALYHARIKERDHILASVFSKTQGPNGHARNKCSYAARSKALTLSGW
jgi:hypothetical protein